MHRSLLRAAETDGGHTCIGITEVAIVDQFFDTVATLIRIAGSANAFVSPGLRPFGIPFRHEGIIIVVVPIVSPLHDVSDNVVETVAVGRKRSHRVGARTAKRRRHWCRGVAQADLWRETSFFGALIDSVVTPGVVRAVESASCGFLPLRFGR